MAIAYFNHTTIKKSAQERPYTAVANLNYNTRQKATSYIGAGGGLTPSYGHIRRLLEERENRIRKDGRVIEKFIIALPREMTMEQSIGTIHKFGFRLTRGGRAPYYFSIQDWNTHNPHVHFVLLDQDWETGKTVAKAWERNSTHRFKRLWQDVANDDMAEMGIDARIDFDAAEEKAQQEAANDNLEPVAEAAPLSTVTEVEPTPESAEEEPLETEDADDGDEDMATLDLTGTPLENVFEAHRELEILHNAQAELKRVQHDFSRSVRELETAAVEAGVAYRVNEVAKQAVGPAYQEYQNYLKDNGRLKGLAIGVGRWTWKSKTRRQAEEAALSLHGLRSKQEETARSLREHEDQVKRWENAKAEYHRQEEMLNNQLRRYSNGKNQDYAEKLFTKAIRQNMEKVSLEELRDLYEQGQLSEAKYRQILHIVGAMHELDDLDAEKKDRSEGY